MKILPDENLPKKLKYDFGENHEVLTVRDKDWNGKKNGELLGLMGYHDFEGFVTIDKNLAYQQNIPKFPIKIFVLEAKSNKHQVLQSYIEKLKEILKSEVTEQVTLVTLTS